MATTTFSGPIKAGSIRQGASANLGFVKMSQSAAYTQSTTAASTGIIIPANSQITEITIYITTACDGASQNLSVGTSSASTEIFTALALGTAANVIKFGSAGTITDADTWADVGSSDVTIFVDTSAGSAGRGFITVDYIQNNNLA
jgi:hypothetical protein